MDDLIRRADVFERLCEYCSRVKYCDKLTDCVDARILDSIPAVDAVEVVRCRECIHRKKYQEDEQQGNTLCALDWKIRKLDWYCADGQCREESDE